MEAIPFERPIKRKRIPIYDHENIGVRNNDTGKVQPFEEWLEYEREKAEQGSREYWISVGVICGALFVGAVIHPFFIYLLWTAGIWRF